MCHIEANGNRRGEVVIVYNLKGGANQQAYLAPWQFITLIIL
jgi:hypothetical protein